MYVVQILQSVLDVIKNIVCAILKLKEGNTRRVKVKASAEEIRILQE